MDIIFVAALVVATIVGAWIGWGRTAWRGIRTGKVVSRSIRGDIWYDRSANPLSYWSVLISKIVLVLLPTGAFVGMMMWAVAKFL
jgi:hypothetical protein